MVLKSGSSERVNRRYLLIKAEGKKEVEEVILDYIGILGWARAAPFFVEEKRGEIILAVKREAINEVRAAIEISGRNIKIIGVSGTIKGLRR